MWTRGCSHTLLCVLIVFQAFVTLLIVHQLEWVRAKRKSYLRTERVHKRDGRQLVSCKSIRSISKITTDKTDVHLTCSTFGKSSAVSFKYNTFSIDPPLFITKNSSTLFYLSETNRDFLRQRQHEELKGKLYIVRRGTYDLNKDCGYKSQLNDIVIGRHVGSNHSYNIVAPIFTPESWTFQHFLDSALPKLIQSIEVLHHFNVTLLFEHTPRDEIVYELLDSLKFSRSRIAYGEKVTIFAEHLFFTCITPPLHPFLWRKARRLIGVPETLHVRVEEAHVVFVTRNSCFNCGRVIQNGPMVIKMLEQRYGKSNVKIFNGNLTLAESIYMFGNARIIMGAHGGGLYNINFAPVKTVVIEFMPTNPDGSMMAASKTIIWAQTTLLGQIFWRMCLKPIPDTMDDMNVPIDDLDTMLDVIDKPNRLIQTHTSNEE